MTPDCFPHEVRDPTALIPQGDHSLNVHLGMTLADVERRLIVATMSHMDGTKTKTAVCWASA